MIHYLVASYHGDGTTGRRPSIGRIVVFTPAQAEEPAAGVREYAALVTQVCDENGVCNLYVFPPLQMPRAEACVREGIGPRTWHWPPRIGVETVASGPP
jgi:hypothetical protein